MTPEEMYSLILLAVRIWRESRGELYATKVAVAWSIRNRVLKPGWWGHSWESVILMPWQYSSFNRNDPNTSKWPNAADPSWIDSLDIAAKVFGPVPSPPDPTNGATSYFDRSLDGDPPKFATDGSNVKACDSGRLHFYKLVA